jgi:hypothetical protein
MYAIYDFAVCGACAWAVGVMMHPSCVYVCREWLRFESGLG